MWTIEILKTKVWTLADSACTILNKVTQRGCDMADQKLNIATCQFAVGADIANNADHILRFIDQAADGGADIVHFSECALSGYPGFDHDTLDGYDFDQLRLWTRRIMSRAADKNIWVILGSIHQLTAPNRPHNCLYLIGPDGQLIDRYDKRFCTDLESPFFTPGDRFVTFDVNGVKCALLICFDLRFPEIYRQLSKLGIQCIFQSFYNARQKGPSVHTDIMHQSMQCRAATNYMWVSMTNSSAWYCPYPSCFIRPDGRIVDQLEDHRDAMMINTVDLQTSFYDPSKACREQAIDGKLTNGNGQIDDERSQDTKIL